LALPSSGTVSVLGQDISAMSSTARAAFRSKNVGFVFQMFHLLPYLTVLDNVLVAADNTDMEATTQRATELLGQFSLQDRLLHRPGQLSAGERQRVAMARALLPQPRLLLADEPTGNLDPENAAAVLQLLQQFHAQGGTILLVTHDEQAASHAARTIILSAGKLADESPATATAPEG
ncbi:MAG: ATP-binding cassette domain-containing protein, partial [Pirellulaceae bacterium]